MNSYNTKVINLIAGPGAGKTVFASKLFVALKQMHYVSEFMPEYAKTLVWAEDWELLTNQHHVSYHQYKQLKALDNKVQYIVMDGSLFLGHFYNHHYEGNMSHPDKTDKKIQQYLNEFDNIFIYIERSPNMPYEEVGRVQTKDEALQADEELVRMLEESEFDYKTVANNDGGFFEALFWILDN